MSNKEENQKKGDTKPQARDFDSTTKSNIKAGSGNLSQAQHDKRESGFSPNKRTDTTGI